MPSIHLEFQEPAWRNRNAGTIWSLFRPI